MSPKEITKFAIWFAKNVHEHRSDLFIYMGRYYNAQEIINIYNNR